jgi:hypothetical protein
MMLVFSTAVKPLGGRGCWRFSEHRVPPAYTQVLSRCTCTSPFLESCVLQWVPTLTLRKSTINMFTHG